MSGECSTKETVKAFRPASLPVSFGAIVDEICRFANIPEDEAANRVWREALEVGWNVARDVEAFGVTAHCYDEKMETLYREGTGFIFETMVYWAKSNRQAWSKRTLDRLLRFSANNGIRPQDISILLLGDGVGNEAIFITGEGFNVDYFDVPGSRTYDFAVKRFNYHGLLGKSVRLMDDYHSCFSKQYDVVISFEVLEHLPSPRAAIADIGRLLKLGGIALITEAFGAVFPRYPTHLRSNFALEGKTPFLFLRNGMRPSWYARNPLFKPWEFVRVERNQPLDWARLLADGRVLKSLAAGSARRAKHRILKAVR